MAENLEGAAKAHPAWSTGAARAAESANLDFLRSVAVLAVFFRHFLSVIGRDPSIPLGSFGVMIFFVHTSLVLMMSLERMEFSGRSLFTTFYIRRFFRIFPLSMVCVTVVAFFRPHPDLSTFLANFFLCMNLFYKPAMIYVLWSLPYEVQMYVALPLVYLFGKMYRLRGILILWLCAVGVALIQPHVSGRLGIAMYVPCFLGGVASYFAGFGLAARRLPFVGWPIVIAAGGFWYAYASDHDLPRLGMWLMCILIGLTAPLFKELRMPVLRTSAAWIARYSYGIYLVHIYALSTGINLMRHEAWWMRAVAVLAIGFGLPVLLYHLVESPMIRLGASLTSGKKASSGFAPLAFATDSPEPR